MAFLTPKDKQVLRDRAVSGDVVGKIYMDHQAEIENLYRVVGLLQSGVVGPEGPEGPVGPAGPSGMVYEEFTSVGSAVFTTSSDITPGSLLAFWDGAFQNAAPPAPFFTLTGVDQVTFAVAPDAGVMVSFYYLIQP